MRFAMICLVVSVVACHRNGADAPSCKAVATAARKLAEGAIATATAAADQKHGAHDLLAPFGDAVELRCDQRKWSAAQRACVAKALTVAAATACVPAE